MGGLSKRGTTVRYLTGVVSAGLLALFLLSAGPPAVADGALLDLSDETRARDPAIAVDDAGTAHIVWNVSIIGSDDDMVYCRVPRGATGCDRVHRFNLAGEDPSGPKIVITHSGEIVIATVRCCFPSAPVFTVTSGDDGESFGAPVTIASEFSVLDEVAVGPGDFSLALSGGNSGPDYSSIWRAAPLDGSSPGPKALLSPFPKAYSVSTGFPDPTSPIVAYSDLNNVFFRKWDGTGDYNDVDNWLPEGPQVAGGDEPKLVSGVRGVYLIYLGSQPPYQYYVRSYDGSGFPASTEQVVSDPGTGQSAIFRDFTEDGEGNLHAVFRQRTKQGVWKLQHRVSRDGNQQDWDRPAALATGDQADNLYHLRVGAAPDGGGAVVGDNNGVGRIWFAPFGPLSTPPGTCKPLVKLGQTKVRALKGCFKKQKKSKAWVASGPVKVNGIDIEPNGGGGSSSSAAGSSSSAAGISAGFKVTAKPGDRTLKTSHAARVHAGAVLLDIGKVNWKLPAKDGKVVKLGGNDGSAFKNLGKFTKELYDLPVIGDAELKIKGSGTEIPAHFKMPGILGSVSGNTTFETNQYGFDSKDLKIDVPKAAIGLLSLAGIDIKYDGADRFSGKATIALPPNYSKTIAEVSFAIEDGELSLLKVEPPAFDPTLPIIGSPPTPLVGLDRIAFSYVRKPESRLFTGDVFLLGGPKLGGFRVATLDGQISLEFPSKGPTTLSAGGKLSVVKIPFASGSAVYSVGFPGTFNFNGSFNFPPPGIPGPDISGYVQGGIDLSAKKFSASGGVAGIIEIVFSSKGFAACITVPGPPPDIGASWKWGSALPSYPFCPDVGSFKVATSAPAKNSAGARISATPVNLPGNLEQAAIAVLGQGGAPLVTVTGPDGETVAGGTGTVEQGRYRITPVPDESRTIVQVGEPLAGNYSIDTQPGSVPIDQVLTARGLPQPKVTAKVRGKKRKRRVNFRIRKIAGQRVTFAEQAVGVYRELKTTKKAKGGFRFSPAPGPRGRREIVALVEQNGLPRTRLTVATYRAPATAKAPRPRRARAFRRGSKLVVKWKKTRRVHGYRVRVNLPRDGRRLIFITRRKQTRIKVGGIEKTDVARVTVAGIGADARPGRKAVAKLKAKKHRRHKKKHRRHKKRNR